MHPSIRSAADLKGKSVAVTGFSGLPYTGLLLCLKELGMTKDQVVPLNIGGKSARFEACSATCARGNSRSAVHHVGGQRRLPFAGRFGAAGCTLSAQHRRGVRENLRDDADGRAIRRGAGGRHALLPRQANKEDSLKILAKYLRLPLEKNRALIEEGYETYRDMMLRKPYADPGAMKILVDIIAESNPKAKGMNLAALIDSSFVERLDREGAFEK